MATCRIDPVRVELLRILISCEPAILSKISFQDGSGRKTGKKITIREDGSVIFYCGKGPLWWQRCCNDYELVSIVDVALRIADVITGSHGTRNELAFDGITKSILDEAIKKKDYDCVVDILFDSMRNCSDGALHSKYINQEAIQKYAKENGHRTREEITIEGPLLATLGIDLGDGRVANVVGQVKNKIIRNQLCWIGYNSSILYSTGRVLL